MMNEKFAGVVLICIGLLFVTPYVSPKILLTILGIYLIVQGIHMIKGKDKKNF